MADDPRAAWAKPAEVAAFFSQEVKAFEKDGGEHNDSELPDDRLEDIVARARPKLGWEGVKIDLYCPDHGVREVERTFTSLGWSFDRNCPHDKQPEEPAKMADGFKAMRELDR
eukprot:SAG22_NODE_15263_length_353_cov_0.606299_1_plen_112_part_01